MKKIEILENIFDKLTRRHWDNLSKADKAMVMKIIEQQIRFSKKCANYYQNNKERLRDLNSTYYFEKVKTNPERLERRKEYNKEYNRKRYLKLKQGIAENER